MTGSLADAACGTLTETSGSVPPPLMTAVVGAFALYFALNSSNTFCSVAVNSPPASSLKKLTATEEARIVALAKKAVS